MSWSKSASGNSDEVLEQISKWPDEQQRIDKAGGLNDAATEGHRDQIMLVGDAIAQFISNAPEGAQFNTTGYGHHNGADLGNAGLSVSYSFPPQSK